MLIRHHKKEILLYTSNQFTKKRSITAASVTIKQLRKSILKNCWQSLHEGKKNNCSKCYYQAGTKSNLLHTKCHFMKVRNITAANVNTRQQERTVSQHTISQCMKGRNITATCVTQLWKAASPITSSKFTK